MVAWLGFGLPVCRPPTVGCHNPIARAARGSAILSLCAVTPSVGRAGHGVWRSLVARFVRDEEAAGSNPVTPTIWLKGSDQRKRGQGPSACGEFRLIVWLQLPQRATEPHDRRHHPWRRTRPSSRKILSRPRRVRTARSARRACSQTRAATRPTSRGARIDGGIPRRAALRREGTCALHPALHPSLLRGRRVGETLRRRPGPIRGRPHEKPRPHREIRPACRS